MRNFVIVAVAFAIIAACGAQSLDECLQQDSISCIQKSLFRKARDFFEKDSFELVSGVSLVKVNNGRSSRSGKDLVYEQEIDQANNVAERQNALENFVGEEASSFFSGRSLRVNFSPIIEKIGASARALSENIPTEIKQAADEVVEGRGKKKILKKIMPLLLIAKAKVGVLAVLAYFALVLIAKKAIIASIISIAISAFFGLKSLWANKGHDLHHDTTSYSSGWASTGNAGWAAAPVSSGWSSGAASSGAWDDHSAHAQNAAYSGYH